jgi:hypothetical protein
MEETGPYKYRRDVRDMVSRRWSTKEMAFTNWSMYRYPIVLDVVIQSKGIGFVGTERSTMSLIAKRRVETWNKGVSRIFKFGRLGADDH